MEFFASIVGEEVEESPKTVKRTKTKEERDRLSNFRWASFSLYM